LGDGHNPVNYPTNPRSARESAALQGRAGGSEISRMSSNILTNFVTEGLFFARPIAEMRKAKLLLFLHFLVDDLIEALHPLVCPQYSNPNSGGPLRSNYEQLQAYSSFSS